MEEDSPAEVDSPVVEGARSSGEVEVRSFEAVVLRNPAAVDTPRALVLDKTTSSGAQARPEEASKARAGKVGLVEN